MAGAIRRPLIEYLRKAVQKNKDMPRKSESGQLDFLMEKYPALERFNPALSKYEAELLLAGARGKEDKQLSTLIDRVGIEPPNVLFRGATDENARYPFTQATQERPSRSARSFTEELNTAADYAFYKNDRASLEPYPLVIGRYEPRDIPAVPDVWGGSEEWVLPRGIFLDDFQQYKKPPRGILAGLQEEWDDIRPGQVSYHEAKIKRAHGGAVNSGDIDTMGILGNNAMMQTVPEDTGYWSYGGLPQANQQQGSAAMIQPPPQPAAPPQQNPRQIDGLLRALSSQLQRPPQQQGMQPPQGFAFGGRPRIPGTLMTARLQAPQGRFGGFPRTQGPFGHEMRPQRPTFAHAGPVSGPGTGRDDAINALLSDGEYVMDAESVSLLGDGSNKAGAQRLDELRERLRAHKGQALTRGEFSPDAKAPEAYLRGGQ